MVFVWIALGLVIIAVAGLLLYRAYLQRRIRNQSKRLIAAGGISSVEEVRLGGLKQYVLIQAEDASKPVLLVLHGGPGMPVPGVGCRGVDWVFNLSTAELIKHFTVVFWDQRGTGKTYAAETPASSMNMEQFLTDASELTDWLRARFQTDKIFLSGVSWGSIIGIQLAHRYPDKFHAYIGIAQIVNWAESDQIAYEWLLGRAQETNNAKALAELKAMGLPPYTEDIAKWNQLRKWLFMLGGLIYEDGQIRHPGMPYLFKTLLASPDYKIGDVIRTFTKGMKLSYSPQMLADFGSYDALSGIRRLDMPVCFFHSLHDRTISGKLLQQFYERLEAPQGKHLTWLEQSAHIYSPADSRLVEKGVIEFKTNLHV